MMIDVQAEVLGRLAAQLGLIDHRLREARKADKPLGDLELLLERREEIAYARYVRLRQFRTQARAEAEAPALPRRRRLARQRRA